MFLKLIEEDVQTGCKCDMYVITKVIISTKSSRNQKKLFEQLNDTNLEDNIGFKKSKEYL
mgnify:FL=1